MAAFAKISSLAAEEGTATRKLRPRQNVQVLFTYLMMPMFMETSFFTFLAEFGLNLKCFSLPFVLKIPENLLDSSPQVVFYSQQHLYV